eukprot:2444121-Amphidinium_carterae.1
MPLLEHCGQSNSKPPLSGGQSSFLLQPRVYNATSLSQGFLPLDRKLLCLLTLHLMALAQLCGSMKSFAP